LVKVNLALSAHGFSESDETNVLLKGTASAVPYLPQTLIAALAAEAILKTNHDSL
jgi:hypothetical protein